MKSFKILLFFPLLIAVTKSDLIHFVKTFIENEVTPTMIVFNGLCWDNYVKLKLIRELLKMGVRTSSSPPLRTSYQDQAVLFLTDLDCPRSDEVLLNATSQNLIRLPFRWLVLTSSQSEEVLAPVMTSPFLVNSDMVLAEAFNGGYKLSELHKITINSPMITAPRGFYNGSLFDTRLHRELFRRRKNLMGFPITMANLIQNSNASKYHLLKEDRLDLQNDYMAKNSWSIARLGIDMLNATPNSLFTYRFGYKNNGKWNGMIKDIMDNKADMGTNIGVNIVRQEVVTFVDSIDNTRVIFILRQPPLSYVSNIFSLPFSSATWLATILISLGAVFAFYLTCKFDLNPENEKKCKDLLDATLGDAFLITVSAVGQQGCDLQPRNISGRIILWIMGCSLMAIYAAYSANIIVLLQAPSNSINNLAELAKAKIALGAHDVDYNYFLFKGHKDPLHKEIAKRIDPDHGPKPFVSLEEGVEKIRKGLYAFHSIDKPVYRQVEKTFHEIEKCNLIEIDYMGYSRFHVPANKQSPYLELFRVMFKQIREAGLISAVNFRYEIRKPTCRGSVAAFSSVGMMDLKPVVLFMIYGMLLSLGIGVAEIIVFKLSQYRPRHEGKLHLLIRNRVKVSE